MSESRSPSRSLLLMPFWQWKEQQYAKDQAAGTPHSREWYFRAYGGYCNKERQQCQQK